MTDPITPLTPQQERIAKKVAATENYLKRDGVALDQFANVVTDGSPDETISSRMARWDKQGTGIKHHVGRFMSKALNLFSKDHGAKAEASDFERAQAVEKIEENTGNLPLEENQNGK